MPTLIKNAQIRKNTIANDRLVNSSVTIAGQSLNLGGSLAATTLAGALALNEIGSPGGSVGLNSQKITGLADPSDNQDAATKSYVDGLVNGLSWKNEAKVASQSDVAGSFTSNGVFTLGATGALVLDGVSKYELNDSVLLKNQTNNIENGIYEVTTLGEGRHLSATFKLDTSSGSGTEVSDYANKEITITVTDGSDPVAEVFVFENTSGGGSRATGADNGGKITVQMNGKNSAEQIMRELELAIGASDSVLRDLAQVRIVSFVQPSSGASSCVIVVESLSSAHTNASAIEYGNGGTAFPAATWRNAGDTNAAPTTFGDAPVAAVLTRRSDANTGDLLDSAAIFVKEGDVSADAGYVVTSDDLEGLDLAQLDNQPIAIAQFTGGGQLTGTNGILKNGNDISLNIKKLQAEIVNDDMAFANNDSQSHAGDVAFAQITVANNGSIATGAGSETEVRIQPADSATAIVFKAKGSDTGQALEFEKGGSDTASATNLAAKINAHANFTAFANGNVITVKHAVVHNDANSRTITFANNGDPAAFTVSSGDFDGGVAAGSENFHSLTFGTHLCEVGSNVATNPGSCTSIRHVEVYQNGIYLAGKVSASAPTSSDLSDLKFNRMDCYVQISTSNGANSKIFFAPGALDIEDFVQVIHAV